MINHAKLKCGCLSSILLVGLILLAIDQVLAQPFAANSTARKSITKSGAVITALTHDSEGLVFQDYSFTDPTGKTSYEPRYLALSTTDSTFDDGYPGANGRCTGFAHKQIYWKDDYSGSVRCVSYLGAQGNNDSYGARIAGGDGEEGRYVAFESLSSNLTSKSPLGQQQVFVHDRKGDYTWLSTSQCVPNGYTVNPGADQNVYLWGLSNDGKTLALTTDGDFVVDNSVDCSSTGFKGVLLRDGSKCIETHFGECYTLPLYDRFGYHANSVMLLDSDAFNVSMNTNSTIVVFDSQATIPTHYNPDISGYYDIYMHKDQAFSVISRSQVPRCSLSATLLPIINDNEPANGNSTKPKIDGSGRYVVFESTATDLVVDPTNVNMICKEGNTTYYPHPKDFNYISTGGYSQVYLYDAVTKIVSVVSQAYNSSTGANGDSNNAWISKDGHYILYDSEATNILSSATTSNRNIFMYDRIQDKTYLVTPGMGGNGLDDDATITHVSNSGLVVAFQSRATNAVDPATNGGANGLHVQHVYLAQNSCPTDTDGDGVPDCLDLCPADQLKTEPSSCGCGKAETDSDADLVPDCIDSCPSDAAKSSAGQCGCGVADKDSDKDGIADCNDKCPADNSKSVPGKCGCGVSESDSDGDGVADCSDSCPADSSKSTLSGGCTCSDLKSAPGSCGCNVADTDANGNGVADCLDPSTSSPPSAPTVDITRTTPDFKAAKYQLFIKLQSFVGKVSYNVTLTIGKKTYRKTSSENKVIFSKLDRGNYVLSYTVGVGSGASSTTTPARTVNLKLPGGISTGQSKISKSANR